MKIRFWCILCCVCIWLDPLVGEANSVLDLIEHFPSGQINWTRGMVTAKGAVPLEGPENISPDHQMANSAYQQAVQNVYNTLLKLRIDNRRCAENLLTHNSTTQTKIEGMAAASNVVNIDREPSGKGAIYLKMSFYGGFAQLILPSEIRQVQPIRPLNGKSGPDVSRQKDAEQWGAVFDPNVYTGLIVDARGTGAKPTMVPILIDEQGHEIFGPAYVSREFAVQRGLCQYIRLVNDDWPELPRVAPRPLVVKGLGTKEPGNCHILISNTDASRIRGASSHLAFLKQCRVVIVLD